MRITKCDRCKKVIKEGDEGIVAGLSFWKQVELCSQCGAPVREFLERNHLIREGRTTTPRRSNTKK